MLGRIHHPDRSGTSRHPTNKPPLTARSANRLPAFQWKLGCRFALLNLGFSCSRHGCALLRCLQLDDVWNARATACSNGFAIPTGPARPTAQPPHRHTLHAVRTASPRSNGSSIDASHCSTWGSWCTNRVVAFLECSSLEDVWNEQWHGCSNGFAIPTDPAPPDAQPAPALHVRCQCKKRSETNATAVRMVNRTF